MNWGLIWRDSRIEGQTEKAGQFGHINKPTTPSKKKQTPWSSKRRQILEPVQSNISSSVWPSNAASSYICPWNNYIMHFASRYSSNSNLAYAQFYNHNNKCIFNNFSWSTDIQYCFIIFKMGLTAKFDLFFNKIINKMRAKAMLHFIH